jgi:hypothetical protein
VSKGIYVHLSVCVCETKLIFEHSSEIWLWEFIDVYMDLKLNYVVVFLVKLSELGFKSIELFFEDINCDLGFPHSNCRKIVYTQNQNTDVKPLFIQICFVYIWFLCLKMLFFQFSLGTKLIIN